MECAPPRACGTRASLQPFTEAKMITERWRERPRPANPRGSKAEDQVAPAHKPSIEGLLILQGQAGNAAVAGIMALDPSSPPKRSLATTTETSMSNEPAVQRRNGFRPPPRPPRRPPGPPSRGRLGQLEGQRLPRNSAVRREAFERRERERIDTARRRFAEEVVRSQAFLKRWGEEGSEPKTAAERALRALGRIAKDLDDVTSAWNEAHESFKQVWTIRLQYEKEGVGTPRQYELIDKELLRIHSDLTAFDEDFFGAIGGWQAELTALVDDFDWKNPGKIINTVFSMIGMTVGALVTTGKLKERITEITRSITFVVPITPRSTGPSMRAVD